MKNILFTSVLSLCFISGTALANTDKVDDFQNVTFHCADNQSFNAVFINDSENNYAVISDKTQIIPMKIIPMASGANYKSVGTKEDYILYTKGDKADLFKGDDKPLFTDCVSSPVK